MGSRQLVSDKLTGTLWALLDVIGDGVALVDALSDKGVISPEKHADNLLSYDPNRRVFLVLKTQ
jgi:hypothetical protein